jgi:hypothetical protein
MPMTKNAKQNSYQLLQALKALRLESGIETSTLEDELSLGVGWIKSIEDAEIVPNIDIILALVQAIGCDTNDLINKISDFKLNNQFQRGIYALGDPNGITVYFPYTQFDAQYRLKDATEDQFNAVIESLREGLSKLLQDNHSNSINEHSFKMDAVVNSFMTARSLWPNANPSDIWWFIIYRAYCDPFNHPAKYARLNHAESWKRTSGWALEKIVVDLYFEKLQSKGIEICIPTGARKIALLNQLKTTERLEYDKVDICLVGKNNGADVCFGVVHVKASFAERRTDDVPMSQSLLNAGYVSPLWTMDCKSPPAEKPVNKGELGKTYDGNGVDRRSAKRKDIEDDGYFSACFSYNTNTKPTPDFFESKARIYTCSFDSKDNTFENFIASEWEQFRSKMVK